MADDQALRPGDALARQHHAPVEGWLVPLPQLGVDGVIAIVALLLAAEKYWYWMDPIHVLVSWTLLALLLGYRLSRDSGRQWLPWSTRQLWSMLIILTVALTSSLWSPVPYWSAYQALWLIESTFLGFFIGYRFDPRQIVTIFVWMFVGLSMSSIIVVFLFPDYGVEGRRGWSGVMATKNELGYVSALFASLFFIALLYDRLNRIFAISMLIVAIVILLNAKSASGLLIAGISFPLIFALWLGRQFRVSALLAVVLMVSAPFVLAAGVFKYDTIASWVERDSTLTNRTSIWASALEIIEQGPLIGFGQNAVWGHGAQTWFPNVPDTSVHAHAHNGYLHIATSLGLPIAVLATVQILAMLFMSFTTAVNTRSSIALFAYCLFLSFTLINLVENRLYQPRRLEWILWVVMAVSFLRQTAAGRRGGPTRV